VAYRRAPFCNEGVPSLQRRSSTAGPAWDRRPSSGAAVTGALAARRGLAALAEGAGSEHRPGWIGRCGTIQVDVDAGERPGRVRRLPALAHGGRSGGTARRRGGTRAEKDAIVRYSGKMLDVGNHEEVEINALQQRNNHLNTLAAGRGCYTKVAQD
jgi:hypothetical protein